MPNLKTIFPGLDPNDFGSGAAQVSTWAKGDDLSLIPSSKLPAIEIGNTFTFDALGDTESASLSEFYAETGNQYNKGDMLEVQGSSVLVPTSSGYLGTINFSDDFSVSTSGSSQIDISAAVHAPVAYNVTATSAADTSQTLVSNAVRVIPGATLTVTYTLPSSPNVGDWVKLVNLSGRTDTIIARNAQPIQGSTSDLVLNDATANFELIYIDGTTGWALMGIN